MQRMVFKHLRTSALTVVVMLLIMVFVYDGKHINCNRREIVLFPKANLTKHQVPYPPIPHQRLTVVTALYDINRTNWQTISRSFEEYLEMFKRVLGLNNYMVIFTDDDSAVDLILQERFHTMEKTVLKTVPFAELEYYQHLTRVQDIMLSPEFQENNSMLSFPEAYSAKYIIVTSSKASFVSLAIEENTFNSTHFAWLDAGFGHGKLGFPDAWIPEHPVGLENKVTMGSISNPVSLYLIKDVLHKMRVQPALCGGAFFGDKASMLKYTTLFNETFLEQMNKNIVDDDQGTALNVYFKNPALFFLVPVEWTDANKLFMTSYVYSNVEQILINTHYSHVNAMELAKAQERE